MSVPSYPFYSLPLKLPNKGTDFPFPPLKLQNKRNEEYSKIILIISFHSIPSSQARPKCTTAAESDSSNNTTSFGL